MKNVENIVKCIGLFVEAVENRLNSTDGKSYTLISSTNHGDMMSYMTLVDNGINDFNANVTINEDYVMCILGNNTCTLAYRLKGDTETTLTNYDLKEDMFVEFQNKIDQLIPVHI